ncbi:MAG: DUF4234 domain-containing protein [Clostridia bacterium]|nr:DUF4234 domain-containing protein [Clostridia bacterium]MBQ4573866.1 DUF4234 domain-containing protein [Clostridia bacterium]
MLQKRNFLTFFLLNIVTCGLYSIYFWYLWVEDVNRLCDGDGKPAQSYIVVWLLSLVTCGIYGIYFFYVQGDRLANIAPRYGKHFDDNGSTLLIWMVLGYLLGSAGTCIAYYILVNNTNILVDEYNKSIPGGTAY